MSDLYYPDVECSDLPLREGHAPLVGCSCYVCAHYRKPGLVPVVLRRDPYYGVLTESALVSETGRKMGTPSRN